MDQNYSTTDTLHKKGVHLTFEERVIIQTRLRDNQLILSILVDTLNSYKEDSYAAIGRAA